jgi:hypothetical protein
MPPTDDSNPALNFWRPSLSGKSTTRLRLPLLFAAFLSGCGEPLSSSHISTAPSTTPIETPPVGGYEISIVDLIESNKAITGAIETNIPLPVEIMVGAALHGQGPKDTYIGRDLRMTLSTSPQAFSIPIDQDGGLPTGTYDVEATFYPLWGAKNGPEAAQAISTEISASKPLSLRGSGEPSTKAIHRKEARYWLMSSTAMGDAWNLSKFETKLGKGEEFKPTGANDLVTAYYFPDADVTLFVNKYKNEMMTYRMGRDTALIRE